ncbi:MAG: hypothetical protein EHM48_07145, partial [Planctomycetaceae bacterium]
STTHNLLWTLTHRGYLERTKKPIRYRLGKAFKALPRLESERDLLLRAIPRLIHVAELTDADVLFSEYISGEIMGLLRVTPGKPKVVNFMTLRMSAYGTGLVFQAFLPPEQVRKFRKMHPISPTHTTTNWKSMREVDEVVADVRKKGYLIFDRSDPFRVSAPVFDAQQTIRASVSALIPTGKATPELRRKTVRLVRTAAKELSQPADGGVGQVFIPSRELKES